MKTEAGLYGLIGGVVNGELTSSDVDAFLSGNILDCETTERLLAWKEELEF